MELGELRQLGTTLPIIFGDHLVEGRSTVFPTNRRERFSSSWSRQLKG